MDQPSQSDENREPQPGIRSLKELLDMVSGRSLKSDAPQEESGLSENPPFPFFGLVGQMEMKLALLLALINPTIGGVLLIGPRGTGKTTAIRSLLSLFPDVERSACFYGCMPEDIEAGGIDAVCPDCARKYGEGRPLSIITPARMVELPLNSRLEDVIGGLDERAAMNDRLRLRRGILAQADRNILFVDEVNLMDDNITNAILDAAAVGTYTLRRGPLSATYNARFTLIGTMNPEEGNLRSQIMDRFGLRVIVKGLEDPQERLEAYDRVRAYRKHPAQLVSQYAHETGMAREEIQDARKRLQTVELPTKTAEAGIRLIQKLGIDSLRAEITLFETARAYTAADGRIRVNLDDLRVAAPMTLRLRQSTFMNEYFGDRQREDEGLISALDQVIPEQDLQKDN
jgi:magnesium chelatase subunit I